MAKYWAYINGQQIGPIGAEELKKVPGFNRGTMVYPDALIETGTPEDWTPAFKVPEICPIPFTPVSPPSTKPVRSENLDPFSLQPTGSDPEKIKMMEQVQNLEKELQKLKGQEREVSILKSQLREKELKIFELSQELSNLKGRPVSAPSPSNLSVIDAPEVVNEEPIVSPTDYLQLDIPFKKIAIISAGVLAVGLSAWAFSRHADVNQFLKRVLPGIQNAKNEAALVDIPVPPVTEPLKKRGTKEDAASAGHETKKTQQPEKPLSAKDRSERDILQKYRKLRADKKKLSESIQPGMVMNDTDPSFRLYLKVQGEVDLQESELKGLLRDYKEKFGEEAWKEFNERAKNQSSVN